MNRIKAERLKAGLTQSQLAKLVGTTGQTILNWENELYQPKIQHLQKLAKIFNCTVSYLLNEDSNQFTVNQIIEMFGKIPFESIIKTYFKKE